MMCQVKEEEEREEGEREQGWEEGRRERRRGAEECVAGQMSRTERGRWEDFRALAQEGESCQMVLGLLSQNQRDAWGVDTFP